MKTELNRWRCPRCGFQLDTPNHELGCEGKENPQARAIKMSEGPEPRELWPLYEGTTEEMPPSMRYDWIPNYLRKSTLWALEWTRAQWHLWP